MNVVCGQEWRDGRESPASSIAACWYSVLDALDFRCGLLRSVIRSEGPQWSDETSVRNQGWWRLLELSKSGDDAWLPRCDSYLSGLICVRTGVSMSRR
jgi:hypothetical protein